MGPSFSFQYNGSHALIYVRGEEALCDIRLVDKEHLQYRVIWVPAGE